MDDKVQIVAQTKAKKKNNPASRTKKTSLLRSLNSPVDQVLELQRTIGNQAIQRMLNAGVIQAKLNIGQPNDKYEQEADRVAEQVMRMPEPQVERQPEEEEEEFVQTKPFAEQITPLVQRQVEPEEDEVEEEPVQTKQTSGQAPQVSPSLEAQIQSLKGRGKPLPESDRAFFEPRFGYDFSQVRVHVGTPAAETARTINARAFAAGRDIVFGAGQFSPGTTSGRQLLAHELIHVVQQSAAMPRSTLTKHRAGKGNRPDSAVNLRSTTLALQYSPSRLVPDLEVRTVRHLEHDMPNARSDFMRQQLINVIVRDRGGKGTDFSIMAQRRPLSSNTLWQQTVAQGASLNANGRTVPPGTPRINPGPKPLVLIGHTCFGPIRDPSNLTMVQQYVVRLYSSIMHEYQHARQWQDPARARAMGAARREIEAYFWEIEHSREIGLSGQRGPFQDIWDEARGWWLRLSASEKRQYRRRCQSVLAIARGILGPGTRSFCGS